MHIICDHKQVTYLIFIPMGVRIVIKLSHYQFPEMGLKNLNSVDKS